MKKDKTTLILTISVIFLLIGYAVYMNVKNENLMQTINNSYEESFYELIEYANNVKTLLQKVQIANTPEHSAKTLTEIWREANLAESSLSKIPIKHISIENSIKFFNQVSDYSYSLSQRAIEGKKLTEEEFNNLKNLQQDCEKIYDTLIELESELGAENISWEELTKKPSNNIFAQEVANISQDNFANIEKDLQEYEGLIYDGPFSEHMTSIEPKGLENKSYTEEEARQVIYQYVDKNVIKDISYNGKINSTINAYSYTVELTNENYIFIDITELGGSVLLMNYNKNIGMQKIEIEDAINIANKFLNSHGYLNMEKTYYIIENGNLIINYAYSQNGVICYPDLIKVKVAMDTGEILGLETKGYLNSHTKRSIDYPKIDVNKARSILNPNIEILSERLAIIPTDWSTEILVYEFKGKIDNRNFIVYVNADTGKEEDVFLLIESENGTLVV